MLQRPFWGIARTVKLARDCRDVLPERDVGVGLDLGAGPRVLLSHERGDRGRDGLAVEREAQVVDVVGVDVVRGKHPLDHSGPKVLDGGRDRWVGGRERAP